MLYLFRKLIFPAIVLGILAFGYNISGLFTPGHVSADQAQQCTGLHEYLIGYGKDDGAPICKVSTGCPYGDSVPLGPECDRLAPYSQGFNPIVPQQPVDNPINDTPSFEGK